MVFPGLEGFVAPSCRVCGCTDERACEGGCWWVEDDLCSSCVRPAVLEEVQALVNALCTCGGRGPADDPCPVCELWHLLHGREVRRLVSLGEAALAVVQGGELLRVEVDGRERGRG